MATEAKSSRNFRWRLILAMLILFHLVQNLVVLDWMSFPPSSYPHFTHHAVLLEAATWGDEQIDPGLVWATNRDMNLMVNTAALLVRLLGPSYLSICLISSIALAALLVGVYALGAFLRSEKVGLVAAALLSCFPAIWGLSRLFEEQLADAALAVWTFYFALRLARSPGLKWAIPLTITLVLDYLWPKEITYLIIQALFVGTAMVGVLLFPGFEEKKALWKRLAWALGAALVAAVLCYGPIREEATAQLAGMRNYYSSEAFTNPDYEYTSIWSNPFAALLYYPYSLLVSHIGLAGIAFMLLTIPAAFWARGVPGRLAMVIWIVIPWIVLVFISKKQDMYAIGLLPGLAMLASIGWDRWPGGIWKGRLTLIFIAGLAILGVHKTLTSGGTLAALEPILHYNVDRYDWPIEQPHEAHLYHHIGKLIEGEARSVYPQKDLVRVGIAKYPNYDFDMISYAAMLRDMDLRLYRMINDLDIVLDTSRPVDLVVMFWPGDIQVGVGFWPKEMYSEFPVPEHLMPDEVERQLDRAGYAPSGSAGPCRFFVPQRILEAP